MQDDEIFGIIGLMRTKWVWYSPKIDIKSPDAIHQILMFGKLTDIKSLQRIVRATTIKELFLRYPRKIYTAAAFNFIKNFILRLHTPIDEQKYLKYTPRHTR